MYMDDTIVIQQQANKQVFLDHINSIDPAIQFTGEGNQDSGTIPFLGHTPGRPFPICYSILQVHPHWPVLTVG